MASSYLPLLCCFVLAAVIIQPCYSFSVHTQNTFCDPGIAFVIKGKVKKKTIQNSAIKYKVKILKVFKDLSATLSVGTKKAIRTALQNQPCSAQLVVGNKYVIAGTFVGSQLWMSSCDWIQDWTTLNSVEKDNLDTNYVPNCQCEVQFVTGVQPPTPPPSTACLVISGTCGRLSWCKCNDPPMCSSCSFEPLQPFITCEDNQFPPP